MAVFDSAFKFLDYLGEGDPLASFVGPTDIDIATDTGRIYVVDAAFGNYQIFNPDGSALMSVGTNGPEPGQFLERNVAERRTRCLGV